MVLHILKIIAALATLLTGLLSLIRPYAVQGFTGLQLPSPRGVTEVRAVLGGGFVGLGLAPLILNHPAAYRTVGIMYLVVAAVRLASIIMDGSSVRSNYISLAFEVGFGIILIL